MKEKERDFGSIPEMQIQEQEEDDHFFQRNFNVSFFSDIQDLNSTNISALVERREKDLLSYIGGQMRGGITTIHNIHKSLQLARKDDSFFEYKEKVEQILKEVRNSLKQRKKQLLNVDVEGFTKETYEMIDKAFLREDFHPSQVFQQYVPKNNRELVQAQVQLVERVDVNIMYEIISRFKTFVASLRIIGEIN